MPEKTYIEFKEAVAPRGYITKVWNVESTSGSHLGQIRWYSNWRQYCFQPAGATVFSPGCMYDIVAFCTEQTFLRKKEREEAKRG